tara:strand:+ start:99 stop:203 length:105 start_codon:yes stop_codon:yes gene_type:complete
MADFKIAHRFRKFGEKKAAENTKVSSEPHSGDRR